MCVGGIIAPSPPPTSPPHLQGCLLLEGFTVQAKPVRREERKTSLARPIVAVVVVVVLLLLLLPFLLRLSVRWGMMEEGKRHAG